jgi:hypothetical protein
MRASSDGNAWKFANDHSGGRRLSNPDESRDPIRLALSSDIPQKKARFGLVAALQVVPHS